MIPAGTPYMANAEVIAQCVNTDDPGLCPVCHHATLYRFTAVVIYDAGVVQLTETTAACGSDECAGDEE